MNAQHSNFKILSLIITSGVFIPFFFMPPYWDDIYRHAFKYMGLFDQGRYLLEAYYWVLIGGSLPSRQRSEYLTYLPALQ